MVAAIKYDRGVCLLHQIPNRDSLSGSWVVEGLLKASDSYPLPAYGLTDYRRIKLIAASIFKSAPFRSAALPSQVAKRG